MDKIKAKLPVIFVTLAVLVFVVVVYRTFAGSKKEKLPAGTPPPAGERVVIPTKTPEEVKIISEMRNEPVNILENEISPAVLTVKLHDQVQFFNKSSRTVKVSGEDWGGIPLSPGENMTQSFDNAGTFAYSVSELSLTGQVVVQ